MVILEKAVSRQPPAVSHRPSALSRQPSEPSAFGCGRTILETATVLVRTATAPLEAATARFRTATGRERVERAPALSPRTLLFVALALGVFCGCLGPRQTRPDADPAALADGEFIHYLATVPIVTADEAYRAMLILADGQDTTKSFDERRAALQERGIARAEWNHVAGNVIDRGAVAAMVCKICKLPGGVNLIVFGGAGLGDRRYATRELIYREMMSNGPDYSPITGGELVAVVTRADDLMATRGLYEGQKLEMPTEEEFTAQIGTTPPAASAPSP